MHENVTQSALFIASNRQTGACWSCGSMLAAHYCQACGKVQPATAAARASGKTKQQVVPPDMLEEVFELNMQIEELRMNQKVGAQDPDLIEQLGEHKKSLQQRLAAVDQELRSGWTAWDALVDGGIEGSEPRKPAINQLVEPLNRRR